MFSTNVGDEILKATTTDTEILVAVTRDSRSGRIYVKLVNPTDADAPAQIDLENTTGLLPTATALTLVADSQATNSIDSPRNVVPISSMVSGVKSGFVYTVPARGIVVLTMETRR
jgi:alpha-N-arabinofuranosidase